MTAPAFGLEMKAQEFSHLLPEVAFLNHASYGVVAKQVKDAQLAMLAEYESDPDTFRRITVEENWNSSRAVIAAYLGTTADRIALTVNTTTGINAVLKSLTFQPGEAILQNQWTYGAVKNTISHVAEKTPGLEIIELDHQYPITSTQQIIQEYETILDANPNIKLAVIDQISSQPSIQFPVTELIAVCKSRGVMVLIDGAHCAGQLPLSLDTLGADFYASSLHKWMYCPRGCGILYADPAYHDIIKPSITSYSYDAGFPKCLSSQGTRDEVPSFQCTEGVNFIQYVGGQVAISQYIGDLLARVSDMLITAWGADKFSKPTEMEAPYIKMIRLPNLPGYPPSGDAASQLMSDLRSIYNIWTPVLFAYNQMFLRISGQIYLVDADFERLRDAIIDFAAGKRQPKIRQPPKRFFTDDVCVMPAPFLGKYKA